MMLGATPSFDKIAPIRALHRVPTLSGALVKLFKALRNSLRRHSKQHRYLVTSFAIVHVTIGYTTSVCLQRRFSAARGIAGGGVEPETGSERQIIGVSHKRGAMDVFTPWRAALRVEFT